MPETTLRPSWFVSTFSGPTAAIGNDMRNSFELALDHMGRKMGGKPVEVIYEDDGTDSEITKVEAGVKTVLHWNLERRSILSGAVIVAVNGLPYSADDLKKAITAAKTGPKGEKGQPLDLLVKRDGRYDTVRLDYADGLRFAWLERAAPGKAPAGLDLLLQPRRPGAAAPARK